MFIIFLSEMDQTQHYPLRVRMFLGLPGSDPDPLVRGADPAFFSLINVLSGLE
jgi:hypothetical protein